LVGRGVLDSEGPGRSTFYFLPGRHPIKDTELDISAPPERGALNSVHNTNSVHKTAKSVHNTNTTRVDIERNNQQELQLNSIAALISTQKRTDPKMMRKIIVTLCHIKELSIHELGRLLKRSEETLRTHYVSPMCIEGLLERKYHNIINHPNQKYRAAKKSPAIPAE